MNYKISVIIPVFNNEKVLRQCLDSIANQTLRDIEIICIDDSSSDSSFQILQEYSKKDKRFLVIKQKHLGVAIARNKGLLIATGKYIVFLDSDDFFELDMLEQLYKCSEENNTEVVIYKSKKIKNNEIKDNNIIRENLIPKNRVFSAKSVSDYIFQFHIGWPWDKFYRREYLNKLNIKFQNLKKHNDSFFVHLSIILAEKIYFLDKVFVYYRVGENNSISTKYDEDYLCSYKSFLKIKRYLVKINLYEQFKRSFLNHVLNSFGPQMDNGDYILIRNILNKFQKDKLNNDYFYDFICKQKNKILCNNILLVINVFNKKFQNFIDKIKDKVRNM